MLHTDDRLKLKISNVAARIRPFLPWGAVVWCLFCPLRLLHAAPTTIVAIEVEGNQRVERDAILSRITTRPGDEFSASTLDADLKAIYALGYFKDIRIDVAPTPQGLIVIFHVTEKPSIGKITIEGNEAIETKKIREEGLTVKENAILDIAKVVESVQKIEQLYTDEGYFIAEVSYEIEPLDENQVHLRFRIEENEKVLVREVVILGNEHFTDDELKRYMETREGNPLSWMSEAGKYKAEAFEMDMRRIEFFYYEHGFINCKVEEPVVTLSSDKRSISVRFRVDEGKQYRVGNIDITGDLIFDKEELMKHLVLRKGDVFVRSKFQRDNDFIAGKYQNKGFAFANVNLKTKLHPENLTIDLTYEIQKGHLVYIEEITIVGNYKTHDRIIRRELAIREGEVLSGPAIALSRRRLMRLGFFSNVTFKKEMGSAKNKMRIVIEVEETVTGNLLVGAGFSSVDRFVAQAQISQRNFLGRGYQYQLDAQLGQQRKDFSIAFANPRVFDSRWSFSGSVTNTERQFPDFLRKDRGFSTGIGYRIGEFWSLSGGYNLSNTFLTNFTSETFRDFLFNQEGETLI
ncbi:MAG: outer membrane protein assembly factor BamA, partial [Deltaproteobacteria bacterium]